MINNCKGLEELQNLQSLLIHVKNLNIPEDAKEKIVKTIIFETEMAEHFLIKSLGKSEFEKLRK